MQTVIDKNAALRQHFAGKARLPQLRRGSDKRQVTASGVKTRLKTKGKGCGRFFCPSGKKGRQFSHAGKRALKKYV